MKKILVCFLLGILSVYSQEKLQIKGNIKGIPNDAKLTLSSGKEEKEFTIKDGVFGVEMELAKVPTSVFLYVEGEAFFKYTSFYVGNEKIRLEGSVDDFGGGIKALGSQYDRLRYENYMLTKKPHQQLEKIEEEMEEALKKGSTKEDIAANYQEKYESIEREIAQKEYEFIRRNINTDYGRYLIRFNTTSFSSEQLKVLLDGVAPEYRNTVEIKYLQTLVDTKQLKVGEQYYDFEAIDLKGKSMKFGDYFKGKYVLLDFSNIGCHFCSKAAPKTAALAEELNDRLMYVTYHTGDSLEDAQKYYELKGNKGNVIWNKEGDLHSAMAMYRCMVTPTYLLFSPTGKFLGEVEGMKDNCKEIILEMIK
ncbi:MAG: redoxin domain-containing protein [Flavobacteriaceae bacterium]|jgi:thiol-disulfide isomerase/thioredoxin|nr:redoxin domain-containing protein [Flavobacteriaceae bacterium]